MAQPGAESRRMHYKLFRDIGGHLPVPSTKFDQFVLHTQSFLSEGEAKGKDSAEKILEILESQHKISIGEYGVLKKILLDAKLVALLNMVQTEEKAIKAQIEREKIKSQRTSSDSDNGQRRDVGHTEDWNKRTASVLVVINIAMMVFGGVMIAIGIWLILDYDINYLIRLLNNDGLDTSVLCMLSFGCFAIFVGFLGLLFGTKSLKDKKRPYKMQCPICNSWSLNFDMMHVVSMVGTFGCGLGVGLVIVLCSNMTQQNLMDYLSISIKAYNPRNNGNTEGDISVAWDSIQVKFQCCGAKNYTDYSNIFVSELDTFVPKTCCYLYNKDPRDPIPKDAKQCQEDAKNHVRESDYLITKNCFPCLRDLLIYYSGIVWGVGIACSLLLILIVIVFILLACCLVKIKSEETHTDQGNQGATVPAKQPNTSEF